MTQDEIKSVIPHREPFLMIDEITAIEPGHTVTGLFHATPDKDFFKGHFPDYKVMPGVLQLEALAQAGAVCILSVPQYKGMLAMFGGVEKARFRRQVMPGDILTLEVEVTRISHMGGKARGTAQVDGNICCEAEIMFVLFPQGEAEA